MMTWLGIILAVAVVFILIKNGGCGCCGKK